MIQPALFTPLPVGGLVLARGLLYDPRWPWHAAAHLGAKVSAPKQYLRLQRRGLSELFNG